MQSAYTVLILLMLVSVSKLVGRLIPLPLPLVQIAAGALLALPTLGLHVALGPELFLFLFCRRCCSPMAGAFPNASCGAFEARWWPGGGVGAVHRGRCGLVHPLAAAEHPVGRWLRAGSRPVATDAVAVSAITQDRLPTPLMHMLQGEALMNDCFGPGHFQVRPGSCHHRCLFTDRRQLSFALVALGGLAVGVALSWFGRPPACLDDRPRVDDPATHVVFMLLLPFAAYVLAERLACRASSRQWRLA
ncbi:hypothetical protein GTA07_14730 [Rhodococcus hoagii]|nr:hypothetical protein [Prescottella equi]